MERRSEIRFDANCAAVVEVIFANKPSYVAITGKIINISHSGCLFLSEGLPWKGNDVAKIESKIFGVIRKDCRVYLPWLNEQFTGTVRSAGAFTIGVELDELLTDDFVRRIAHLEPNQIRSFVPKSPWKYNRIIPLAQRSVVNRRT